MQGTRRLDGHLFASGVRCRCRDVHPLRVTESPLRFLCRKGEVAWSASLPYQLQNCWPDSVYGEAGWNHDFQHPKNFSLAQTESGHVSDVQEAGRLFCTFKNGLEYIVWTQNDGDLLGVVSGAPHDNTWHWWRQIHHSISLGSSMQMSRSGSSMKMSGSSGS
jgi:hypothetical protein